MESDTEGGREVGVSKSIPALWVAIVAAGLAIVATVLPDADAAETRRDFL